MKEGNTFAAISGSRLNKQPRCQLHSPFRKGIDSLLHGGRNTQSDDTAGGFRVKAAAQRIEKLIRERRGGTHVSNRYHDKAESGLDFCGTKARGLFR